MELFERVVAFILVLAMSIFFCSCAATENEKASNTPLPVEELTEAEVQDITLMYYTTPVASEFTLNVGETAEFWADVICGDGAIPEVTWSCSDGESLALSLERDKKEVGITALSAENGPATLTVSCGEVEKNYTVHIHGDEKAVSIPGSGEAVVKDIKLMYFTAELNEFTLGVGETVQLYADVIYNGNLQEQAVWTSSNEACLAIECDPETAFDAKLTALSAEESAVTLTLSCAGFEKDFTVYIRPEQ